MRKKLNSLFTNVLAVLFYLAFAAVPIAIVLGCVKLATLWFG